MRRCAHLDEGAARGAHALIDGRTEPIAQRFKCALVLRTQPLQKLAHHRDVMRLVVHEALAVRLEVRALLIAEFLQHLRLGVLEADDGGGKGEVRHAGVPVLKPVGREAPVEHASSDLEARGMRGRRTNST